MKPFAAALAAGLMLSLPGHAAAARCEAISPAHTLALVELYTSEGCDSCPPADRWLRGLAKGGLGPDRVVPISLHVDYWDYIGWKDPYANPLFSSRQRELAAIQNNRVVYTPQVMLAGRDYRGWARGGFADDVRAVNAKPARADIRLALRAIEGDKVEVVAEGRAADARDARLIVAWYESGLASAVAAGENRGHTLQHDYVVREWFGPVEFDKDTARLTRTLSPPGRTGKGGVVAFVQNRRSGEVLQALALPQCGSAR